MGLVCRTRKMAASVLKTEEDDCSDLDKLFGKDSCFNQDDCMWPSSDCSSPSSFFNRCRFPRGSYKLFIDEWLVSCFLLSESSYLFRGGGITCSSVNPVEEASLAVKKTIPDAGKILQDGLEEPEVVTWLLCSTGNDRVGSSATCVRSPESSYKQSSEDFAGSENSSTTFSTHLLSPSQMWDLDRTGPYISILNLDGEDSKWISDTNSELGSIQSDFPSPSFKRSWGCEGRSSSSSVSSITELDNEKPELDLSPEQSSDAADLEDLNSDDPLFWPFERKFDWTTSDCFSMSPRKDIGKVAHPEFLELKLHDGKVYRKEECKKKFTLSSASKILERKQRSDNKGVKRINRTPSRLHKSTRASVKIVPLGLDMNDDIIEATNQTVVSKEKSVGTNGEFLEEDFGSNEELSIESLLGLDEFDGHEGIDLEFNKDDFSLIDSPRIP